MQADLNAFWTAVAFVLVVVLFARWSTRAIREVARHYPKRPKEIVVDCGLYLFRGWYCFNILRIGVSSRGLSLKQPILPGIHSVEAFVPWPETMVRENGNYVGLGFKAAPEIEIRVNKVIITMMQHKLNRRVPFGHAA